MPSATSTLFDEDFLKKLHYLSIVSSNLRPGHMRGEHRARKTGSGLEFADYRAYASGDDSKNLDWRTYLRLDRLLIRLFEEETDLPIYIFVDSSDSMAVGEPPKFDYARKVAAALCYIGLLNLDRVTLISYTEGIATELPTCRGQNQVWKALQFLDGLRMVGGTALKPTVFEFFQTRKRRGLVVLVSDFLQNDEVEDSFRLLAGLRQDVFVIQVVAPVEADPGLGGDIVLVDCEDGSEERIEVTPDVRELYTEKFRAHSSDLLESCVRRGWGHVFASTEEPFEDLILNVFRQQRFLR